MLHTFIQIIAVPQPSVMCPKLIALCMHTFTVTLGWTGLSFEVG